MSKKNREKVNRKGLVKCYYPTKYNTKLSMTDELKKANKILVYYDKIEVFFAFKTSDNLTVSTILYYENLPCTLTDIVYFPITVSGSYLLINNTGASNRVSLVLGNPTLLSTETSYSGCVVLPNLD